MTSTNLSFETLRGSNPRETKLNLRIVNREVSNFAVTQALPPAWPPYDVTSPPDHVLHISFFYFRFRLRDSVRYSRGFSSPFVPYCTSRLNARQPRFDAASSVDFPFGARLKASTCFMSSLTTGGRQFTVPLERGSYNNDECEPLSARHRVAV